MDRIGRETPLDVVDEWIAAVVRDRTFVDIGGIGEFAINERSSWAARSGAARAAMADFEPFAHHLWQHYIEGCKTRGVHHIERYERVNIDDPQLPDRLGVWDVVHSTGILYHVPNPVYSMLNLRRVARRHLIINTVVTPPVIENAAGRLVVPEAGAYFCGALRGTERAVVAQFYRETFNVEIDPFMPERAEGAAMPYMLDGRPSYYPYWWILTARTFEALAETLEMRVRDRYTWRGHAHFLFLEAS